MKLVLSVFTHVDIITGVISSYILRTKGRPILWCVISQVQWGIILAFLFSCCIHADGTVIGALRTPQGVFVASDSQLSSPEGEKAGDFCKVRNYNSSVVAITGVTALNEVGYNPFDIARKQMVNGVTTTALDQFEKEASAKLLQAAQWEFTKRPAVYKDKYVNHEPLISIFAWINSGVPILGVIHFTTIGSKNGPSKISPSRKLCPEECTDGINFFTGGHHKETMEYYDSLPVNFAAGPVSVVTNYVKFMIGKFPREYSGPLQLIKVTSGGVEWLDRPSICPEVDNPK